MDNRNYILDRLKSKTMSIEEFNYESLSAPPISAMFSPEDICMLNNIAKSIKYSAKPQIKYQEIDKIMRRRGFVKFVAGTNRVVYRPLEDSRFVVKVAADAVGLGDNPREYRNQFIFKPFVTKVFEVTPCGTLGVFERVVPITSREEYLSIASDIFEMINNWFIGEYVLEDIGTKYFMNIGIRKGFGPVLLDFPYCYKLDGNKLFCNVPDSRTPSGKCEGVIDYDAGYNFLYCTKCGAKYRAKALEEAIKDNNVIIKKEGVYKMKVSISGGTKNVNKNVESGEFADLKKNMPTKPVNKFGISVSGGSIEPSNNVVEKTINGSDYVEETVKEDKVENESLIEKALSTKEENLVSPISNLDIEEDEEDESIDKFTRFKSILTLLTDIYNDATEEEKSNMIDELKDTFKDDIFDADVEFEPDVEDEEIDYNMIAELFNNDDLCICVSGSSPYCEDDETDPDIKNIIFEIDAAIANSKDECIFESDPIQFTIPMIVIIDILKNIGYDFGEKLNTNVSSQYNNAKFVNASTVNIKELFNNLASKKVIVLMDSNGNYITDSSNNIVAIDTIDDKDFENLSIVSKKWLDEKLAECECEQEEANEEVEEEYFDEDDEVEEIKDEIPTGIFSPNIDPSKLTINGSDYSEEDEEVEEDFEEIDEDEEYDEDDEVEEIDEDEEIDEEQEDWDNAIDSEEE